MTYKAIKKIKFNKKQIEIAKEIGVYQETISAIKKGKKCSKLMAMALLHYIDDAKFEDYFKETNWQYTKNSIKLI